MFLIIIYVKYLAVENTVAKFFFQGKDNRTTYCVIFVYGFSPVHTEILKSLTGFFFLPKPSIMFILIGFDKKLKTETYVWQ